MIENEVVDTNPAASPTESPAGSCGRPSTPEAFDRQRALLFEQYQEACAAIAMLFLYELATAVRVAFPESALMVFGDGENRCLEFEHVEDAGGQIVADAEQVETAIDTAIDAAFDMATICSNIGIDDIGRDTWIRYAPYQRWQNSYHCPIPAILDLPAELLTTAATTRVQELAQLRTRVGELEEFVAEIAGITKEGELPGRPDEPGPHGTDHVGNDNDDRDGTDEATEEVKVWENDDAFDTLHDLITDARQLSLRAGPHAPTKAGDPPR